MKSKTEKILGVLRIVSWIAMIGFAINFGSQLISFIVSLNNPAAANDLPGVFENLEPLLTNSTLQYVYAMSFVIFLSGMSVYLWHLVVNLLSRLSVKSPFTIHVAKKLEKIAHWLLSMWVVAFIGRNYIDWLSKRIGEDLDLIEIGNEFLFIAGIVYIISQIFKQGIEIQEENQQTI